MIVTMHYEDGIEVFDTAERVDSSAYSGNTLSNWAIRLEDAILGDSLGGKRLWLDSYTHEPPEPHDGAISPRQLPVACRRNGMSILLADENDMKRLLRVNVNGETALIRIGDELVNTIRLAHAADLVGIFNPQAVEVHRLLEATAEACGKGDPFETACKLIGYSPDALLYAERMQGTV